MPSFPQTQINFADKSKQYIGNIALLEIQQCLNRGWVFLTQNFKPWVLLRKVKAAGRRGTVWGGTDGVFPSHPSVMQY